MPTKKVRQLRLSEAVTSEKNIVRAPTQIVELASQKSVDVEALAKTMSTREVQRLIDLATEEDVKQKASKKIVDVAKKVLMTHAKLNKWKTLSAEKSVATVSPGTSTTIDAMGLLSLLRRLGKKNLFATVFGVKVGPTKQYLGEDAIAEITTTDTEAYGSLSLKQLRK